MHQNIVVIFNAPSRPSGCFGVANAHGPSHHPSGGHHQNVASIYVAIHSLIQSFAE